MNLMRNMLITATKEGIVVAQQADGDWQQVRRSLTARQVNSLSIQKGNILAGTTDGMFRSDDLGQTWQASSGGLRIPKIRWVAHHPDGSGTVLAGTEPAAIFLSRDGGRLWRECPEVAALREEHGWYLPYSPEAGCVRGFAFHGERSYAAVEQGGLLRSDDRGDTWRLCEGSNGIPQTPPEGFIHPDVHSVSVHPSSHDLVAAPTGGGLYVSKDGGASWKQTYRCYCRAVWLDPANAEHLIVGPADSVDREGRIEETVDGGATWRLASDGLDVPWPRHMVERFLQMDYELLAVLSNGELVAAPLPTCQWRTILPGISSARAVATVRV
jgi:photosystem II stability/assembly factor-like uncharacterized protein